MRLYVDKNSATEMPNGCVVYFTPMPFRSLAKVGNCPCEDGKRRSVRVTGIPDTFFSVPAETTVGKKHVSGYLTTVDGGYEFRAYKYKKNGHLIQKDWSQDEEVESEIKNIGKEIEYAKCQTKTELQYCSLMHFDKEDFVMAYYTKLGYKCERISPAFIKFSW